MVPSRILHQRVSSGLDARADADSTPVKARIRSGTALASARDPDGAVFRGTITLSSDQCLGGSACIPDSPPRSHSSVSRACATRHAPRVDRTREGRAGLRPAKPAQQSRRPDRRSRFSCPGRCQGVSCGRRTCLADLEGWWPCRSSKSTTHVGRRGGPESSSPQRPEVTCASAA